METPSSFLALPRELRENIYLFLLSERHQIPMDPSQTGGRIEIASNTYFETQPPRLALLQLKLCSKQLHAEATDFIRLHQDSLSPQAHLDMLVVGAAIYPTWFYLPLTTTLDPTLDICFRVFSPQGWKEPFKEDADAVYRALWLLFRNLVFKGVYFSRATRKLHTPLKFESLWFHIHLLDPSINNRFPALQDIFDRLEGLADDRIGAGHVEKVEVSFVDTRRTYVVGADPTLSWRRS